MARIGIGIDTGGTYTDAVAYDIDARRVLATAKALTTREDLAVGIANALDGLPADCAAAPAVVALSTTLATNACVENKTGRAKLYFFGGDPRYLASRGVAYGVPVDGVETIACASSYSEGTVSEVDWDAFTAALDRDADCLDGIGIIELYSMRNGAAVEKQAQALARERTGIPVVCGHELVHELDSLRRGASTLVNAGLFPTIHAFMRAIRAALAERSVAAPVVIVRSDGTLMSEAFAETRPAETLLCGPAASVMGAMELARVRDCIVIDMGGTTTDIAVVRDGEPLKARDGIAIGKWKTLIKGLAVATFGLGGDTAVHYRDGTLFLEDYRVVPLCIAGARYPELAGRIRAMTVQYPQHTRFLHEGFILTRDVSQSGRYSDAERRFCDALRAGPLLRREAALAVGKDEYSLDADRLVRDGVVQVFGLTPTDAMHLRGQYQRYDAEASRLGAAFVAANLGTDVDGVCARIYEEVQKRLYLGVVAALLAHEYPEAVVRDHGPALEAMALERYRRARTGGRGFIDVDIATDLPLVGIGAPVHVFLPGVAELLGTEAIVPPHADVANALGAVVGRIHAEAEATVKANYNTEGINGYTVFATDETRQFEDRREAERFAADAARQAARAEALRRGAVGDIAVNVTFENHEGDAREGRLFLATRMIAHAIGSAGF